MGNSSSPSTKEEKRLVNQTIELKSLGLDGIVTHGNFNIIQYCKKYIIAKRDIFSIKHLATLGSKSGLTKKEKLILHSMAIDISQNKVQFTKENNLEIFYTKHRDKVEEEINREKTKNNSIMNFVRNRSNSFTNNLRTLSTSSSRTSSKDSRESNSRF